MPSKHFIPWLGILLGACGGGEFKAGTFAYPVDGAVNVDTSPPIAWTLHPDVRAYRLHFAPSSEESLVPNGEWSATNEGTFPSLPFGGSVRLRLEGEQKDGISRTLHDITFTPALGIRTPVHSSTGISSLPRLEWTPAAASLSVTYTVSLGSAYDGTDLGAVTGLVESSWRPETPLPADRLIYLRVLAKLPNGDFRRADSVFAVEGYEPPPPSLNGDRYNPNVPVSWSGSDLDAEYVLKLYRESRLVHDSGPLFVRQRFLGVYPTGVYNAELSYRWGREWRSVRTPISYGVRSGNSTELDTALRTAVEVHDMAGTVPQKHLPRSTTDLFRELSGRRYFANCLDYAQALLRVLKQMNVGFQEGTLNPRKIHVGFILNGFDGHTLVEATDTRSGDDVLIDPTFLMTFRRGETWASREDMWTATAKRDWDRITYVPLDPRAPSLAKSYYLDLPLLFLNVAPLPEHGKGRDPRPWMEAVSGLPNEEARQGYVFETEAATTFRIQLDGVDTEVKTIGSPALSRSHFFKKADPVDATPENLHLWRIKRYVF